MENRRKDKIKNRRMNTILFMQLGNITKSRDFTRTYNQFYLFPLFLLHLLQDTGYALVDGGQDGVHDDVKLVIYIIIIEDWPKEKFCFREKVNLLIFEEKKLFP